MTTITEVAEASPDTGFSQKRSVVADFLEIAREIGHYRDLLFQLTLRDIRIRYKQAVMGFGWAILMPMLVVLAGVVVRYAVAYLSRTELDTGVIVGVALKAVPWAFFVGAVGFANTCLIANVNLVTKIYFPREVLPISVTLAQAFDSSVGAAALLVALPFFGLEPSWSWLWAAVLVALLVSCANLFFRDVKYIVQVLLTFGIFFTPVFFEPAMFGALGAKLMMLNPLAPLLEGIRLTVVEGHNLLVPLVTGRNGDIIAWSPWYLAYSLGWSTLGVPASAILFHRLEFLFAEYV
jgi:ABC-type polysaccharide/polyol phosphate export permease